MQKRQIQIAISHLRCFQHLWCLHPYRVAPYFPIYVNNSYDAYRAKHPKQKHVKKKTRAS